MTQSMNHYYHQSHILEMVKEKLMLEEFLLQTFNVYSRDLNGRNALYWAIKHRSKHNVKLLIKYSISLMVEEDLHALFHAIASDDYDTFIYLLNLGLSIDMTNSCGQTLLMKAIQAESVPMVRYLINHGADLYLLDDVYNMAIDYAKECKNKKVYELVHYRMVYDELMSKESACGQCQSNCEAQPKGF